MVSPPDAMPVRCSSIPLFQSNRLPYKEDNVLVKFAITLSEQGQSEEGQRDIATFLADHDITLSAKGLSTFSCESSAETFRRIFAQSFDENLNQSRSNETIGAGAPLIDLEVSVPNRLKPYIDHVSVTPPIRKF